MRKLGPTAAEVTEPLRIGAVVLSDKLVAVFREVEAFAGFPVDVRLDQRLAADEGRSFWDDDLKPYIAVSERVRAEGVIAHEVLHLQLRVRGYPNRFVPRVEFIMSVDNFLQHWAIWEGYLDLGFPRDAFINTSAKQNHRRFVKDLLAGQEQGLERQPLVMNAARALAPFYPSKENERLKVRRCVKEAGGGQALETVMAAVKKTASGPKEFVQAVQAVTKALELPDVQPVFVKQQT